MFAENEGVRKKHRKWMAKGLQKPSQNRPLGAQGSDFWRFFRVPNFDDFWPCKNAAPNLNIAPKKPET